MEGPYTGWTVLKKNAFNTFKAWTKTAKSQHRKGE